MADELDWKRQWFYQYSTLSDNGIIELPRDGFWYICPCCGYLTLPERGGYDICCLCNWEDDGQDDPHADEVWGGPNGRYSLTEARANFRQYWVMYTPEGDTRIVPGDSAIEVQAKKAMVEAFDAMEEADELELSRLWETVRDSRDTLDKEVSRKIQQYKQKMREKRSGEADRE